LQQHKGRLAGEFRSSHTAEARCRSAARDALPLPPDARHFINGEWSGSQRQQQRIAKRHNDQSTLIPAAVPLAVFYLVTVRAARFINFLPLVRVHNLHGSILQW
jgi:hypothetical protein